MRLYITQQGNCVSVSDGLLRCDNKGEFQGGWPLERIRSLFIYGQVELTTPALRELLKRGVPVDFFTRKGRHWGNLSCPSREQGARLRALQHEAAGRPSYQREMIRFHLAGKWRGSAKVLKEIGCKAEAPIELQTAAEGVAGLTTIEELKAAESRLARHYWEAWFRALPEGWSKGQRSKRPPRDSANAMLSFGYTLLATELASLLRVEGFELSLAALHKSFREKPVLAYDLMEEFRAESVDRFVLRCIRQSVLDKETHFSAPHPQQGTRLNRCGMKRFLGAWDRWVLEDDGGVFEQPPGHRAHWVRQVRRLKRALMNNEKYKPYGF